MSDFFLHANRYCCLTLVALLCIVLVSPCAGGTAQAIRKNRLIEALRENVLSTKRLVELINKNGVDFIMTPSDEEELRAVGARPELLESIRKNYRAAPVSETPLPSVEGMPFAKDEILRNLRSGQSPVSVGSAVERRGVSFVITSDIAAEVIAAGGTKVLVGTIAMSMRSGPEPAAAPQPTESYEEMVSRAIGEISEQNVTAAMDILRKATQLNDSEPDAYQVLGTLYLRQNNYPLASEMMRKAILRGGSAVFRNVRHDHVGKKGWIPYAPKPFQPGAALCPGSLYISKAELRFEANDRKDTIAVASNDIKSTQLNPVMYEPSAFQVKLKVKVNDKDNWNFAPGRTNQLEAELITQLIADFLLGAQ